MQKIFRRKDIEVTKKGGNRIKEEFNKKQNSRSTAKDFLSCNRISLPGVLQNFRT